jgi:hypothetical protein
LRGIHQCAGCAHPRQTPPRLPGRRRSELVAVTIADIERRPEGLLIQVRRSKAGQDGTGTATPVPIGRRRRWSFGPGRRRRSDPALFNGHLLRTGFLTSVARAGASVFKMEEVSRH